MRPLQAALVTARENLDSARKQADLGNLDMAAASALIAIGELLAGLAAHVAEDE